MYRHAEVQRSQLELGGPAAAAVGLGLAVVLLSPAVFLSDLAVFQFLAVQLGFIGAVYFGFAVADGGVRPLLLQFTVAGLFLFVGTVALWADAPLLLAVGYVAHAVWDLVHHPKAIKTPPVQRWYPPFCVVFDFAVAAFILVWLPLGGVAA